MLRRLAQKLSRALGVEPPKRRWDLISEAIARPLGGDGGGSGPVRAGGVEDPQPDDPAPPPDTDSGP